MTASALVKKRQQRADGLAARATLGPTTRARAAAAIADRLREVAGTARTIAAYAAMPEEVDLDPLLEEWLADGRTVALPRVDGPGHMILHAVADLGDLVAGPFGIRQPRPDAPVVHPSAVDLVVVPGVAFDRQGRRIGHGGGFYDRLLPSAGGALAVAVCFAVQLVDQVATEDHDVSVDAVVTEGDVYRFGRSHTPNS